MSYLEKIELVVIGIVTLASFFVVELLPKQVTLGQCFIWLAIVVFIQSLIRDLSVLKLSRVSKKRMEDVNTQERKVEEHGIEESCMCLESIGGVGLLFVGFLLTFGFSSLVLNLPTFVFTLALLITLSAGYLLKDFVITWRPLSIRREKNHLNVIVKW